MQNIARAVKNAAAYLNANSAPRGLCHYHSAASPVARRHAVRWGRSIFAIGALFSDDRSRHGCRARQIASPRPPARRSTSCCGRFHTGGVAGMFTVGLGLLGAALVSSSTGPAPIVLEGFVRRGPARHVHAGRRNLPGRLTSARPGRQVEHHIPEDDHEMPPLSRTTGDNVGDCAAWPPTPESYAVVLVASPLGRSPRHGRTRLPLLVPMIGVITAIGIFVVSPRPRRQRHGGDQP